MTARTFSLVTAIEDSLVLGEIAAEAGITPEQARAVAAAIGELDVEQAYRLCGLAKANRRRQAQAAIRKSGGLAP